MRSLLFFFAVIAVFIVVMLAATRIQTLRHSLMKKKHDKDNKEKTSPEKPMVKCAQCGVYLPKTEAIVALDNKTDTLQENSETYFCCEEHRNEFNQDSSKS